MAPFLGTFQMMLNSSSLLSFFVSCCQAQERESNIKFFVHHFSASAPLQGTWSLWSPWSSCNQDCLQHRRRACNNRQTLVSNSVTKVLCRGDERESSNCHGDLCNEGNIFDPQCMKFTHNVSFEFFNFGIFHQFLSN